jgi:hypothetical protein
VPDSRRIIADRENVGFDLGRVAVDILSLRSSASHGTDSISTDALLQATETLDGDFLEGLDLPDCRESQSWCIATPLALIAVFSQRTCERDQVGDAGCKKHHSQSQCERRKVGRCRPADGIEQ